MSRMEWSEKVAFAVGCDSRRAISIVNIKSMLLKY